MAKYDIKYKFRNLTVLCPGIILETEDSFKRLSPLLEIHSNDDSSCSFQIIYWAHIEVTQISVEIQAYLTWMFKLMVYNHGSICSIRIVIIKKKTWNLPPKSSDEPREIPMPTQGSTDFLATKWNLHMALH